ncbi:Cytochrome P450 6B7 [Amphibalanus amphitrite]|uniref:Cytochrome P450 6B7 n=1 Tax=Amphibalanus amphitrite TaxID=1232801 RepID=A0A6A4WV64_AMPAM|nr:Cytochrome P450 6B7 [Amphibalanus amphitrite]
METLRLYPVAQLSRCCTRPYTLPGTEVTLPVNTMVYFSPYALQRDPDLRCIAQRFAMLQTKLVLVALLRKCSLEPGPRTGGPWPELDPSAGTLVEKGGTWLVVKSR